MVTRAPDHRGQRRAPARRRKRRLAHSTWGPDDDATTRRPRTTSAHSGLAGPAVIAARAWWAEVLAKAAFVDGPEVGRACLEQHGVSGYLIDDDGVVHTAGATAAFAA
jgi:thiamine biosynthesis lipoprotein ApbE